MEWQAFENPENKKIRDKGNVCPLKPHRHTFASDFQVFQMPTFLKHGCVTNFDQFGYSVKEMFWIRDISGVQIIIL